MKLNDALEYYEMHLYNKNLAESSINRYVNQVKDLFKFLESKNIEQLDEVRSIHLEMYMAMMVKKGNRATTRRNKKSYINSFFAYCKLQEFIDKNPADAIQSVKVTDEDRKKKETLTIKETYRYIDSVHKHSRNKEKNKAIVKIFTFCGLRVSEICKLQWEDIDWKKKTILIRGKGRKERRAPLFPEIEKDLKDWKKIQKSGCKYVFTSKNTDNQMKSRAVYHLINSHAKKARLKKNVGPHTLRRTSATNYLREGVNIRYIQILLGHSNIATTTEYLDPDEEDVSNELKSAFKSMKKRR